MSKIKLPGRVFQLPSKGLFYKEGVLSPSVQNGEIKVAPLSALGEMKLRSPDLLFTGMALKEICQECCPDVLKPELLVSKDVDAIFCFLRIATYGSEMSVRSTHDCEQGKLNDYLVNIENIIINPNNLMLDHKDTIFDLDLSNGQKVTLRPVIFQDMIEMTHLQQAIEKSIAESGDPDPKIIQSAVVRDIMSVIQSVDGISDTFMIEEWVRSLQKKYFNEIIERSKQCSDWGFNLTVDLKCKDCGEVFQHNLELDPINFFSG
jgi:hypothetical protein